MIWLRARDSTIFRRLVQTDLTSIANVENVAGLWMRIDGPPAPDRRPLALDNMQNRPGKGTVDWRQVYVSLHQAAMQSPVMVARERARVGAWYELVPRSEGGFEGAM